MVKERCWRGLDRNTRKLRKERLNNDVVGKRGCFGQSDRVDAIAALALAKSFPRR